jgi:SAM-dependent methyltransferase
MDSIITKIQKDWDDRISLHSRFWMGDQFDSNEEMWGSGKRDLELMLEGFKPEVVKSWQALEYGCGTGRIIPAASFYFRKITAVDVSSVAIDFAIKTLAGFENVELLHNSGADLVFLKNESFDFCYSFACLNHIPLKILSNVLIELTRTLKTNGRAVFQLYVGSHPSIVDHDTLTIRGYPEACLTDAFESLGYKIISFKPLELPFDAYDYERNLTPYLISLEKTNNTLISSLELENFLNLQGEMMTEENWTGSHYEYRLAATLLKTQAANGEVEEAIKTLEFAMRKYKKVDPGMDQLLAKLKQIRDIEE